MPNTILTDLQIRRLAPPAKGTLTYWDANTKGLGLRVSQGGAKTFIVLVGSGRRHKLGRYPTVTLQAARVQAKRTLGEVALGRYMPKSIAFEDSREQFLDDAEQRTRPSTAAEYRRLLTKHFSFGRQALSEITAQDISRRLDRLKGVVDGQAYERRKGRLLLDQRRIADELNAALPGAEAIEKEIKKTFELLRTLFVDGSSRAGSRTAGIGRADDFELFRRRKKRCC